MPATTTSFIASDGAHSLREKIGRALMWLAVLGAVGAAGTALLTVLDAGGATKVVETWRLYGLIVFAGLFALLMLRPHHYKGVWEITIASKLAMTVTAIGYAAHGGITGTGPIIGWDGGLTAVLIAAYVCCRGWTAAPRLLGTNRAARQDDHLGHRVLVPGEDSPTPTVTASRNGSA